MAETSADAPAPDEIYRWLEDLERVKESQVDDTIPGWTVRRPPVDEVDDQIAFVIATSKPGERVPFLLPGDVEATIALISGAVEFGGKIGSLAARRFFVVGAHDSRQIIPLQYPTTIICMFFRAHAEAHEHAKLDSR